MVFSGLILHIFPEVPLQIANGGSKEERTVALERAWARAAVEIDQRCGAVLVDDERAESSADPVNGTFMAVVPPGGRKLRQTWSPAGGLELQGAVSQLLLLESG